MMSKLVTILFARAEISFSGQMGMVLAVLTILAFTSLRSWARRYPEISELSLRSWDALVLSLTVLCLATSTRLLAVHGADIGLMTLASNSCFTAFLANWSFSPPINLFFCCFGTSSTCRWCDTKSVRPMSNECFAKQSSYFWKSALYLGWYSLGMWDISMSSKE